MDEIFGSEPDTACPAQNGKDSRNEKSIIDDILAACASLDKAFVHHYVREHTSRIRTLIAELSQTDKRTQSLVSAALRLISGGLPTEALELALWDAAAIVGAERGFIFVFSMRFDSHDRIECLRLPEFEDDELEIADALSREVFDTDIALLNPDVAIDPRFSSMPGIEKVTGRSAIIAPISVEVEEARERIGVLYLDCPKSAHVFNEHDWQLIRSFASLTALSIRNVRLTGSLRLAYQDTVNALVNALEARDKYTRGHSIRVAEYSDRCGKRFNLGMKKLEVLHSAALLHDIGKIGIRDDVLNKPGRLTRDEFDHVKKHPEISEAILSGLNFLTDEMRILRQHHERYDGQGYPNGLKGDQISLEGAIIQVADAWDAMTSARVYQRHQSMEEAIEELRKNSGTQFNPEVVRVFIQTIEEEGMVEVGDSES